jgi:surface antigen
LRGRGTFPGLEEDSVYRVTRSLLAVFLAGSLLAGCATLQETIGDAPKTTIGALGGAAAGGLLGAAIGDGRTRDVAAGVAMGGLLGALAGNLLDSRDRRIAAEAAMQAFENAPSGSAVPWRNPDSGNYGSYTPTRTYQTARGQYCREFQQEIVIGGRREQAYGTACRQSDGTWQIQS